jgi:hypothetical protein
MYVDGCSFVYGEGLPRNYSLGSLLSADIDMSAPGKSNYNIAYDIYKLIDSADIFVIGFSFSDRLTLWDNDIPLGISPTKLNLDRIYKNPQGEILEKEYKSFHKIFYTLYNDSYAHTLSDFLVDGTIELLKKKKKKFIIFSWEKRTCLNDVLYFNIFGQLPDGHFNKDGMQMLANIIKEKL